MQQLFKVVAIFSLNCYASPKSTKINNDDTFFLAKKNKSMVLQIWL